MPENSISVEVVVVEGRRVLLGVGTAAVGDRNDFLAVDGGTRSD